jgi:hypothetical protein
MMMDFISGASRPQGVKSPNEARKKTAAGGLFSGFIGKTRIAADKLGDGWERISSF